MFVLRLRENQKFFSTSFSAPNRNILLNNRAAGAFIFGLLGIISWPPTSTSTQTPLRRRGRGAIDANAMRPE
jgi:hypothetical protein